MASSPLMSALLPQQQPPVLQGPLVPTINFAMVCPGVYRSGYPTRKNYPFLRVLRLRTILYLCPEEYAESSVKFCEESGITILRFSTEGNKEPFMDISEQLMHRILSTLVDTRTHPILIHCNKGKHRTGTVVACLRLLQGWSLVSIFQEYRSFAGDKVRMVDQQYVELYRPILRITPPHVAEWVCFTRLVTVVRSEEELLDAEARQLCWSLLAPPMSEQEGQKRQEPLPPSPPPLQAEKEQQQKEEGKTQKEEKQEEQACQQQHSLLKKEAGHSTTSIATSTTTDGETTRPTKVSGATAAAVTRRSGGPSDHNSSSSGAAAARAREGAAIVKKEIGEGKRSQRQFFYAGARQQ